MKRMRLLGFAGALLSVAACNAEHEPASEHADAPPAEAYDNTELSEEQLRHESELLQAAFDKHYTREEQAAMVAAMEREGQPDFTGKLTPEEVRTIHAQLAAYGVSADRVAFAGRMVKVDHEDAYFFADDLLGVGYSPPHQVIEKGYVLGQTLAGAPAYGVPGTAPDLFARISSGNFQFWRPALSRQDFPGATRRYFIVLDVQNPTMPSAIRTALIDGAKSVENANTDDCLVANTFQVIDPAEWNAKSNADKLYHYRISVRYSRAGDAGGNQQSCDSLGATACANFPRQIIRSYAFPPSAAEAARMSFGNYLGINSIDGVGVHVPGISATDRKEVMAHEIGHLIGLSHPFLSSRLHVPGTEQRAVASPSDPDDPVPESPASTLDSNNTYDSFMQYDNSSFTNYWPISDDDKRTLRKLYPAVSGCPYTHGFQTIN
jgi:hypothetical protein